MWKTEAEGGEEPAGGGGWRRQDWAYLGQKLLDFFTSLNSDLFLFQIKDSHDCLP